MAAMVPTWLPYAHLYGSNATFGIKIQHYFRSFQILDTDQDGARIPEEEEAEAEAEAEAEEAEEEAEYNGFLRFRLNCTRRYISLHLPTYSFYVSH